MFGKKEKILPLLVVAIFALGLLVASRNYRRSIETVLPVALADDEGSEEEDDDEGGSSSKAETVTTYVKLPDQVVKRNYTVTIYDSDGDGIYDPDDPTPNVHDAFLVKDDDRDGIDDQYAGQ